jgi:hypothetical protein
LCVSYVYSLSIRYRIESLGAVRVFREDIDNTP